MSLLTAMMTFTKNFSNPIYQIFQLLTLLQSAIAGTNRAIVITEQPKEVLSDSETVNVKNLKGHIKFKNLTLDNNSDGFGGYTPEVITERF